MTSTPVAAEQRAFALSRAIQEQVTGRRRARVESQTEFTAVLVRGQRPNHVAHLLASVFTLGLWLPVWLGCTLVQTEQRVVLMVDPAGHVVETVGPRRA